MPIYTNLHAFLDVNTACKCDNCGRDWIADELVMIRDLHARIEPGGEVPAGECPRCSCLAYIKKTKKK